MKKLLYLFVMIDASMGAMESTTKVEYYFTIDEEARIHYLPQAQIDYFNKFFAKHIPYNCPFVQIRRTSRKNSLASAQKALMLDEVVVNQQRSPVLTNKVTSWWVPNNGIPLIDLLKDTDEPIILASEDKQEWYYKAEDIVPLVEQKLEIFEKEPLGSISVQVVHDNNSPYADENARQEYYKELTESHILQKSYRCPGDEKSSMYQHGCKSWFAWQEGLGRPKQRLVDLVTKDSPDTTISFLLLLKRS